jgi:hypothetical protein
VLVAQALCEARLIEPTHDSLLGGADGEWCTFENVLAPSGGRCAQVACRNYFIDETKTQTVVRADRTRGQNHSHGLLEPDLPGEPVQAAPERNGTHQRLRQAEARGVGSDDDVAGERKLEAAAKGNGR